MGMHTPLSQVSLAAQSGTHAAGGGTGGSGGATTGVQVPLLQTSLGPQAGLQAAGGGTGGSGGATAGLQTPLSQTSLALHAGVHAALPLSVPPPLLVWSLLPTSMLLPPPPLPLSVLPPLLVGGTHAPAGEQTRPAAQLPQKALPVVPQTREKHMGDTAMHLVLSALLMLPLGHARQGRPGLPPSDTVLGGHCSHLPLFR
jgi:hypothetical protein